MSYRVFARKYRPQKFSELVGQTPITQTLQNAITNNRLAQAYLFVGPRGVGKTSTARIFAKALNCFQGPTIDPCGTCDACLEIAEGRSLDVLEIDGASNNSVESIRTLRDNAAFAPARGPYKIYLIDEVHMLTTAAFNALLKILEEPPAHVKFLFATTEAQKLPATIISRCQRFDLHRISEKLIAKHLLEIAGKEKITLQSEAAAALAHGADGALRDAESMFDQVISFCGNTIRATDVQQVFGFTPSETIRQLAMAVFQQDAPAALALILEQSEAGKDLARLLGDFIGFVRDLLIEKVQPSSSDLFLTELGNSTSSEKLLTLLEELGNAEGRLRWATNKKLQLDVAIIKAIHLLQEVSLSDVLNALTELRGGVPLPAAKPQAKLKVEVEAKKVEPKLAAAPEPPKLEVEAKKVEPKLAAAPEPPKLEVEIPIVKPAEEVSAIQAALELPKLKVEVEAESKPAAPTNDGDANLLSNPWNDVAVALAAESRLKFGWVELGKFVEQRGNKIVVEFPPSCEGQTETLFWPQARKKIQECLSKNLGVPVELLAQFTGTEPPEELMSEPAYEEPEERSAPTVSKVLPKTTPNKTPVTVAPLSTAVPALTPEALENFKKDPLIQKALEIFRAEIVTG